MFLFPTVILGTFFTNGETPFCNTSIFHIVKGSFCTFVTERSAYMEMFRFKTKKELSDFNIYYFQLCFLYISVLRKLYSWVCACVWRNFTSAEEGDQSGVSLSRSELFFFSLTCQTLAGPTIQRKYEQNTITRVRQRERERRRTRCN